jgi:mRNA interferase MazF
MPKSIKQGDIVLIPYPYSDLSSVKKRPVIVVSKNGLSADELIVAKITSVISGGKLTFQLNTTDLVSPLPKPSEIRTNQIFTAHKSLIIKKISSLNMQALKLLNDKIQTHFEVV